MGTKKGTFWWAVAFDLTNYLSKNKVFLLIVYIILISIHSLLRISLILYRGTNTLALIISATRLFSSYKEVKYPFYILRYWPKNQCN